MATTKREAARQIHQADTLIALGFTPGQAETLRRISMTLHRWFELECGDSNDHASWAIERDEQTDKPYMVRHYHRLPSSSSTQREPIADRESGARRRLRAIIANRNDRAIEQLAPGDRANAAAIAAIAVSAYIQGDPRGAVLYIIRPGDVPDGGTADAYYNRGICVY